MYNIVSAKIIQQSVPHPPAVVYEEIEQCTTLPATHTNPAYESAVTMKN